MHTLWDLYLELLNRFTHFLFDQRRFPAEIIRGDIEAYGISYETMIMP